MKILSLLTVPPPFTGQAIGSLKVLKTLERLGIENKNLNLHYPFHTKKGAFLNLIKMASFFTYLLRLWMVTKVKRYDTFYFVSSGTNVGVRRDNLLLKTLPKEITVVAHVRSGDYWETLKSDSHIGDKHKANLRRIDKHVFLDEKLLDASYLQFLNSQVVIPNSIDIEIDQQSALSVMNQRLEKYRVDGLIQCSYISNFIETKGYLDLLSAFAILKKDSADMSFRLKLIGNFIDEGSENNIREYVEAHGLSQHVTLVGPVTDREKIVTYYKETSVFILPTYYPTEAQPRSIIEAMNFGCSILATDHASIKDAMLEDGNNGYIVKKKNPDDIARALLRIEEKGNLEKFCQNSRSCFERRFMESVIEKQILSVFSSTDEQII